MIALKLACMKFGCVLDKYESHSQKLSGASPADVPPLDSAPVSTVGENLLDARLKKLRPAR